MESVHIKLFQNKTVSSCEFCEFEIVQSETLTIHMKENHELSCTKCDTKFVTKNSLELHMKFKHGEQNQTEGHDYDQCEYKSTQKTDLIMHIENLHEKNVSCDSCKINPQENCCLDCTLYYCKPCVKIINIKSDMDKVLQKGILEKLSLIHI